MSVCAWSSNPFVTLFSQKAALQWRVLGGPQHSGPSLPEGVKPHVNDKYVSVDTFLARKEEE